MSREKEIWHASRTEEERLADTRDLDAMVQELSMIDRNAQTFPDRRVIADFWAWLCNKYCREEMWIQDVAIWKELDDLFKIDAMKLDDERRELLHLQRDSPP